MTDVFHVLNPVFLFTTEEGIPASFLKGLAVGQSLTIHVTADGYQTERDGVLAIELAPDALATTTATPPPVPADDHVVDTGLVTT